MLTITCSVVGGGCGIRTHVTLLSNGFQDRLVMTASITLRVLLNCRTFSCFYAQQYTLFSQTSVAYCITFFLSCQEIFFNLLCFFRFFNFFCIFQSLPYGARSLQKLYRQKLANLIEGQLRIEKAIESLTPTERELMRLRYIDGAEWLDVAAKIHYKWTQTHRIHARVLAKLRDL